MAEITAQPTGNPNLLTRPEGRREWLTNLSDCGTDFGTCMCTFCCLSCMCCRISQRLDENCMMPACVPGSTLAMRVKIRTMGGITGSIFKDCLASFFCTPCVICQMSRELDNMGL